MVPYFETMAKITKLCSNEHWLEVESMHVIKNSQLFFYLMIPGKVIKIDQSYWWNLSKLLMMDLLSASILQHTLEIYTVDIIFAHVSYNFMHF